MSDHPLTTEYIRDTIDYDGFYTSAEFDRWLAEHDAERQAEVDRLRAQVARAQSVAWQRPEGVAPRTEYERAYRDGYNDAQRHVVAALDEGE